MNAQPLSLSLPFPPSVNHYWRRVGNKTLISAKGREYREEVQLAVRLANVPPQEGRLAVSVTAFPPDRRRRDLDNLLKALLDALQAGGVYEDDSQIDQLCISRCYQTWGGRVLVNISTLPNTWNN